MRLLLASLLCSVLCVAAVAQPPAEPRVQVEFSSVSSGAPIPALAFTTGGSTRSHVVPAYRRSAFDTYAGPATMEFTEPLPEGAPPDTKPRVVRVTLPADTPRVILLWHRAADGTLGARALSEDPSVFPPGRARLVNATGFCLAVKTADEVLRLEPGEFAERGGDGKRFILQIAFQYEENGKWLSAGNNVFALSQATRRTIFFLSGGADYFKLVNSSGSSLTSGVQMFSIED